MSNLRTELKRVHRLTQQKEAEKRETDQKVAIDRGQKAIYELIGELIGEESRVQPIIGDAGFDPTYPFEIVIDGLHFTYGVGRFRSGGSGEIVPAIYVGRVCHCGRAKIWRRADTVALLGQAVFGSRVWYGPDKDCRECLGDQRAAQDAKPTLGQQLDSLINDMVNEAVQIAMEDR